MEIHLFHVYQDKKALSPFRPGFASLPPILLHNIIERKHGKYYLKTLESYSITERRFSGLFVP